jgi:hypothetical protein
MLYQDAEVMTRLPSRKPKPCQGFRLSPLRGAATRLPQRGGVGIVGGFSPSTRQRSGCGMKGGGRGRSSLYEPSRQARSEVAEEGDCHLAHLGHLW